MLKYLIFCVAVISLAESFVLGAETPPPALLFSDITSGTAAGGQNDQGAIITLTGRNFGVRQNDGFASIGGTKAAAYLVWNDTKISFQPGKSAVTGKINVTTAGGTSNGLPFSIRGGRIFFADDNGPSGVGSGTFADPWRNVSSFLHAMRPGDILYFRGGSYGSIVLGSGQSNGTSGNDIAFIGYPGETAKISGGPDFDLQDNRTYFVIAGFSLYSTSKNISVTASHVRIVNNDIEGLKGHAYGMIHPIFGSDIQIYGNTFHGATSGNKLDHPIYVGYGSDSVDIGWNHFYNNKISRGPVISINTDGAQQSGYKFDNIRIHDNEIDVNGARAIGIVCVQTGSSVFIYNNIFTGSSAEQTVYMYSGSLYMYNNIFYGSPGAAAILLATTNDGVYTYRPEIVTIKNNIIWNRNGGQYLEVNNENDMQRVTIANNDYYGAGTGPARDTAAINANPRFVDPENGNFSLQSNSPCINKGADITSVVAFDKDGYVRSRQGAVDIGACEYSPGRFVPDAK